MDLICIPFHDFKIAQREGFRTRDSHLYAHFSKSELIERTIIINRPTMLGEIILNKKKLNTKGELIFMKNGVYVTKISEKLFCIDILDFSVRGPIIEGKGFINKLYVKNLKKIQLALEYLKPNKFITYESSPLTHELCASLESQHRIFDGVDNFCKHPTYQKCEDKIKESYNYIVKNYNNIYFNSTDSIRFFNLEHNPRVHFLANGVDFEKFQNPKNEPKLLKDLPRPLVVYAGKMQDLLDVDLIKDVSRSFSNCTFLLLGKVLIKEIKVSLASCKNVIFGGDIIYEELPDYICSADICFIPYRIEKQHGGDPIKFYEYMAANKPIVSTEIGEIKKYHNGRDIFICSRSGFIPSLRAALSYKGVIINELPTTMKWQSKSEVIIRRALNEIQHP